MTKAEKIYAYVKEAFEEYCLNYKEYFFYDFGNGTIEEPEWWILEDGKINMDMVAYASEILGISSKDIVTCNEDAVSKWIKKYPYIWHINSFVHSYTSAYYAPGYQEMVLLERLFDTKLPEPYPSRYNGNDIRNRLIEELKELDKSFPGTFHKDAEITDLIFSTNVYCSFDDIEEMTSSFIEMVYQAKKLFFKALSVGLEEDEINEYNILVSLLKLRDRYFTRGYLHYSNLIRARDFYKEVTEENFYDNIIFRKGFNFEPWRCIEFINNPELVEKYLQAVPDDKAAMRKYAMSAAQIFCVFRWSDAKFVEFEPELEDDNEEYKEVRENTSIYIKKKAEEMDGYEGLSEKIYSYCRPAKLGGVDIQIPAYDEQAIFKRMPILNGKIKDSNFVQHLHDEINGGGNNGI